MKAKRILSFLLIYVFVFCFFPAAASADGSGAHPAEVSTWADLEAALASDGEIVLAADVTPENPFWADALVVPSGVTVTLDLNGHVVDRGYTESGWDGSVIKVLGSLTLIDSAPDADHGGAVAYTDPVTGRSIEVAGGVLTGGWPDQFGGGVYINGGVFNLQGGSIVGNGVGQNDFGAAEGVGGGVYMQSGSFNMSGGAVVGNKALNENTMVSAIQGRGGGVYIHSGTFTLSGGTICGNTAGVQGGGIFVGMSASFNMTAGMICFNTAGRDRSIYNEGTAPDLALITLVANNESDITAEQAVLKNTDSALAANCFIRDGYGFLGWNTEDDGTGTGYADGATLNLSDDTTLYARWGLIATVAKTPEAIDGLIYNAAPQKLVTEGEAIGGTMQYALGDSDSAGPTSDWSGDVPEETNAGTYDVWYKVLGDSDHADSEPERVAAGIAKKELTVTANDQEYLFNGQIRGEVDTAYEDPAQIAEKVTVEGLEGDDALTSITLDGNETGPGVFEGKIVPSNAAIGEATGNYDIAYAAGKLTIVYYEPIYEPVPELPFTDVTRGMDCYDDVKYVYNNGIMKGVSDTLFAPEEPLTRDMIVTILYRAEGEPAVAYSGAFSDVPEGEWFSDGVEWAASAGIVLGYGDGTYGGADNVSREQLAAILYRYAQYKKYKIESAELTVKDADSVSDWAKECVKWAAACGVLKADGGGNIRPTEDATRAEIAAAIHVFLEKVSK